jgi:protoheme IX farnesyltransferase
MVNKTSTWRNYYELCKPRVVALMLLTSVVGMLLATDEIPWRILILGTIGIGLSAGAGGVLNQLIDRRIDGLMGRTKKRPIPLGQISPFNAGLFAFLLSLAGMLILIVYINTLTAILTFVTLVGYAFVYTVFLKRATPQNIVIGGLAGATPPLLGWTAVTNSIDPGILLLVLLIFTWTPPHFWALAIARYEEYQKAEIPMLPVTHGISFTKLCILLYTILMVVISLMPFIINLSGLIYLIGALGLGAGFVYKSIILYKSDSPKVAMDTFYYSIFYLMMMFILLLIDHYYHICQ